MGLFDQIVNAFDNPNQQGNPGQMANILNTVQQLSNTAGTDPSTMQSAVGIVGNYVRSALQEKRNTFGNEEAQSVVNQYSGTSPNPDAVSALFSPYLQQQIGNVVSQRTGLNAGIVQQMLPILVPIVLNLLQSGANNQNPQAGGNPVLNSFLDSDRDGDVDITDAMRMAGRYFNQNQ